MTGDRDKGAEGTVILCAANSYEEKYYLNPMFKGLPESIQKELQIICVLFTEEIGGLFILEFDKEGNLLIRTEAEEIDYMYDEIGAALMVKEIQKQRMELLQSLELYYKTVILGIPLEEA